LRWLAALLVFAAPAVAADDDPWAALESFRANLRAAGPLSTHFVQSFVPEGFSTGEEETGSMKLSVPECLRWDYDEPYPKAFLLCGDVVHFWNPGESEGRIEEIEADREPGLDLLLVEVEVLRERYEAEVSSAGRRGVEVRLRPREQNEYVVEATLVLSRLLDELQVLRYVDPEGNRTEFRISDWRPGVAAGSFNPPVDVEWLDDY
jgi:hypothetical protein